MDESRAPPLQFLPLHLFPSLSRGTSVQSSAPHQLLQGVQSHQIMCDFLMFQERLAAS